MLIFKLDAALGAAYRSRWILLRSYDRWNVAGYDRDTAVKLCHEGINPLVAVVLASRGQSARSDIDRMTGKCQEKLSNPMLLADMSKASERVRQAINGREHVAVYGDYDVDGITSSCLVADYLRSKGLTCDIYIPDRLEEGYGVKSQALDTIKSWGASLVITVDCGITAFEEARYAAELGLDLVITDHHECGGETPQALAAVDPKRPDCESPAKDLAGVGVAFKLICAVEGPESDNRLLDEYGDLVAAGTIADVMPVTGENRVIIRRGLELIRTGKRPGIGELCSAAGLAGKRTSVTNVGFVLAPRINAAGRIGSTDTAVGLLLTKDKMEAAKLALELCGLNKERQRIESEMFKDALEMLKTGRNTNGPVVLSSDMWHQGVAGIVASRIVERVGLPTVIICVKDGVGRGSCRSVEGFNIYDALSKCSDILLSYGGHEMAAGLTIEEDKIDDLRDMLGKIFSSGPAMPKERFLNVDFEVIKPRLITLENIEALEALEPYGTGNPQPLLCMRDMCVENVTSLGEGKHTKMWLSKNGNVFEAVFFSKNMNELRAQVGIHADVAFTPQVNEFRGRRSVQLNLVDFIVHDN